MNIVCHKSWSPGQDGNPLPCVVHALVIQISDHQSYAKSMLEKINENNWINHLNPVAKVTYKKRVERTAEGLARNFAKQANNSQVQAEFGEYMISMSTVESLVAELDHKGIPLSELWKEKLSGNPGFDFHTETPCNYVAFGEAKYRSTGNAYQMAGESVVRFIGDQKDFGDAEALRNFVTSAAMSNLVDDETRSFTLAFSISSNNCELIFQNAMKNKHVKAVAKCAKHLFLVGVKS